MKKILAIVIIACLVLSAAACGKKNGDSGNATTGANTSGQTVTGGQGTNTGTNSNTGINTGNNVVIPGSNIGTNTGKNTGTNTGTNTNTNTNTNTGTNTGTNTQKKEPETKSPSQPAQPQKQSDPDPIYADTIYWYYDQYWVQIDNDGDPELVIYPEAARSQVKYSSSDPSVATVNDKGIVHALKGGNTVITANCNGKTADLPLEVRVIPKALKLSTNHIELKHMSQFDYYNDLTVTLEPEHSLHANITFTSSDSSVATVTAEGHIQAHSMGHAVITATDEFKNSATCDVYVTGKQLSGHMENTVFSYNSTTTYFADEWTYMDLGYSHTVLVANDVRLEGSSYLQLEYIDAEHGTVRCVAQPSSTVTETVCFVSKSTGLQSNEFTVTINP